jgi:ferredoxin-NADP reductase
VLASAGIGVTPMMAMLHAVIAQGRRPLWFVHGARDGGHHPLAQEVRALAAGCPAVRLHVAYSRPRPEDRPGVDYDSEGRIDGALLTDLTAGADADYLLCGPAGFMAAIQTSLEARGVAADRIHSESFGPLG